VKDCVRCGGVDWTRDLTVETWVRMYRNHRG
jgi:hypothetical protein